MKPFAMPLLHHLAPWAGRSLSGRPEKAVASNRARRSADAMHPEDGPWGEIRAALSFLLMKTEWVGSSEHSTPPRGRTVQLCLVLTPELQERWPRDNNAICVCGYGPSN
ncbi:Hypothetical predicted protein [Marmota monax]|uniref:Uncharacterized protein n=1 Tax=Marmota monax TaxID=9995 RepID=A0A5E4CQD8_MARMO|nr:hypothetical protein GHT09_009711 [Marmota monax]VTJ84108.1 Hypothetical predicted protein [Marmota monax]